MAAKRTNAVRDKARAFVAEKYLMQWTQQEIADHLGVTQQQVSYDLKAIQKAWRESALVDMNEAKQRELERVDRLEREYWQAWEASQEDAETITKKAKGDGQEDKEVTLQKKGQAGDPRFLAGIQWCIERRCKLLGVDAPNKTQLSGDKDNPIVIDNITDEERASRITAILDKARDRRD